MVSVSIPEPAMWARGWGSLSTMHCCTFHPPRASLCAQKYRTEPYLCPSSLPRIWHLLFPPPNSHPSFVGIVESWLSAGFSSLKVKSPPPIPIRHEAFFFVKKPPNGRGPKFQKCQNLHLDNLCASFSLTWAYHWCHCVVIKGGSQVCSQMVSKLGGKRHLGQPQDKCNQRKWKAIIRQHFLSVTNITKFKCKADNVE